MPYTYTDTFLIFVPDGRSLPRIAKNGDAVRRAMDELGRAAHVLRITENELCRDVTSNFTPSEPDEYEDDETSERRYRASRAAAHSFGRRSL